MAVIERTSDSYLRRVIDDELDELMTGISAIAIEGAKGVGKTRTAVRRARTIYDLDLAGVRTLAEADPWSMTTGEPPILVDEWQRYPPVWDRVRRAVDDGAAPGSFLMTGSATPRDPGTHSGAGRIVRVHMRPLALSERALVRPTVSLRTLLTGTRPRLGGDTSFTVRDYVREICASGLPGLRGLEGRALRTQIDSYLARIVDRDVPDAGRTIRSPAAFHAWMTAYAAATATNCSYDTIRDAATAGDADKPAKATMAIYREVLERIWILDPLPGWVPSRNPMTRLVSAPKHHLADPAFAVRLLGMDSSTLLGALPDLRQPRGSHLLGPLFESLIALNLRVYAQQSEAKVSHLRTRGGEHEVDFIIEHADHRIVAVEVKLTQSVTDSDVKHLAWLQRKIGDDVLDAIVITTGNRAYRRQDGIGVVPAALLGP